MQALRTRPLAHLLALLFAAASATTTQACDLFHDTSWADATTRAGAGGSPASTTSSGGHGGPGTGGADTSTVGTDAGSTDAGADADAASCDDAALPADDPCVLRDDLGIFVRSGGDDASAGTKEHPVRTLTTALALAMQSGKRVYACAETFPEAIVVPSGARLIGGLDCASGTWEQSSEYTELKAPPHTIPIDSAYSNDAHVHHVIATAADATYPGESSVAARVVGGTFELDDCILNAGSGAPGIAAEAAGSSAPAGLDGNPGTTACATEEPVSGGAAVLDACATGASTGGAGGVAWMAKGGDGAAGLPVGSGGQPGKGQPASGAWSCAVQGNGKPGADGAPGEPGGPGEHQGSIGSGIYVGADGQQGKDGAPGQGGGGGGGTKGAPICANATGAAGGSGGTGGCGGQGGLGGGPGGSSIGLLLVSTMTVGHSIRISLGTGGNGGQGAPGQSGGDKGHGAKGGDSLDPILAGCAGADGGRGGDGGPGGGGNGGHAIGLVFHQSDTGIVDALTVTVHGTPGEGGLDGTGSMTNGGTVGSAADYWEFPH